MHSDKTCAPPEEYLSSLASHLNANAIALNFVPLVNLPVFRLGLYPRILPSYFFFLVVIFFSPIPGHIFIYRILYHF